MRIDSASHCTAPLLDWPARAMALRHGEQRAERFSPFVLVATAVHAALFVFGVAKPRAAASSTDLVSAGTLLSVEVDAPPLRVPVPTAGSPGSGSPIVGGTKEAVDRSAAPFVPARVTKVVPNSVQPIPGVEPPRSDEVHPADVIAEASPSVSNDIEAALAAEQAAVERRQRGIEAAMAAAAGAGGRGRGGPGGNGTGWPAPAIRGSNAFGNGSHGALTGQVCFLPVGTLRIADVRDCKYVATVYTDTLDIPERHFYDGFPGVTDRSEWFLIDYTGTFTVREYGSYAFRLHSDDGSYLYIDGQLVIENDGKHAPESRSGSIPLVVGRHRILVRYAQTNDRMALQLFVRTPQDSEERIFTPQL
jgi:hypothetical protein